VTAFAFALALAATLADLDQELVGGRSLIKHAGAADPGKGKLAGCGHGQRKRRGNDNRKRGTQRSPAFPAGAMFRFKRHV
jgi:hypothetical protein